MKAIKFCALTAMIGLFPAQAALAQELAPRLSGAISVEVQNDWAYDSDDPDLEKNTLFTKIEPYFMLSLTDRIAVEAALVMEPVTETEAGKDTAFDNEGAFVEELKLSYTGDDFYLYAGKYNPTFGIAWDLAPGIYGRKFAEDYEITERIGFGGSYTANLNEAGIHTLSANTFFLDTSFLSDSAITKRGDTDKSDGGSSNTEDPSSFSVTLDSEAIAGIEGLTTHIGYRFLKEGDADTGIGDETGYALGATYSTAITDHIGATALVEWVGIENFGGPDDVNYVTTSLSFSLYEN